MVLRLRQSLGHFTFDKGMFLLNYLSLITREIYLYLVLKTNAFVCHTGILFFLWFIISAAVLVFLVFILGCALRIKVLPDLEKTRPFECGFTPKFSARLPFSIRFFLVALVFLVFDVELVLMFPLVIGLSSFISLQVILITLNIIIILIFGLGHEWNQGRLDWAH